MSAIQSFRDLDAWKTGMALARECYRLTERLPKAEQFGLCQQIRRAVVSVPSNIAEGQGRRMRQPYANHVNIALGSLSEVETQLELSCCSGS
jgi:four helix bundle protein